jgi:hypothetical protein
MRSKTLGTVQFLDTFQMAAVAQFSEACVESAMRFNLGQFPELGHRHRDLSAS